MKEKVPMWWYIMCAVILFSVLGVIHFLNESYPQRYAGKLDKVFGEDRWTYESKARYEGRDLPTSTYTDTGQNHYQYYTVWRLTYTNEDGEVVPFTISNYTRYDTRYNFLPFGDPRFSNTETMYKELCFVLEQKLEEDICDELLAEQEWASLVDTYDVLIKWNEKRKPSFYNKAYRQEWFNIDRINANDYFSFEQFEKYEGYLDVSIHIKEDEKVDEAYLKDIYEKVEARIDLLYGEDLETNVGVWQRLGEREYISYTTMDYEREAYQQILQNHSSNE